MTTSHRIFSIFILSLTLSGFGISPAHAGGAAIAGLWEVQGTPDGAPGPVFTNLVRLSADGGMVNIDPWFGTGLGKWTKTAGGQYEMTFTHYFLDGGMVGEAKVTGVGGMTPDKQFFQADFVTEISVDGVIVAVITGIVEGTRQ